MSNYRLESQLERDVCAWAKSQGGYAVKLLIDGERGWPDQTIWLPGGRVVVPELKRPFKNDGGSVNQVKWLRRLQRLGHAAGLCESVDDVQRLFETIGV